MKYPISATADELKQPRDNINKMINDKIPPIENWYIGRNNEEYTFDEYEVLSKVGNRTYLIVIIYDVTDNKRRYRISKILKGYGEWVQRSAFECHLTMSRYEKMMKEITPEFDFEEDMLRVYRLTGQADIKTFGKIEMTEDEDTIII